MHSLQGQRRKGQELAGHGRLKGYMPHAAWCGDADIVLYLQPQNTKVEKTINELFEGHTYNFIECIDVEYKSTRKESFMDLQLDVKGCKNIYDSFDRWAARRCAQPCERHFPLPSIQCSRFTRTPLAHPCRYTEVEVLNGQNQYKTDDFGMQVGVG